MVLKNLPSGNNAFMKSFLKIRMKKVNTKLEYKTYKKLFESIKKRYTFLILFVNTNIT